MMFNGLEYPKFKEEDLTLRFQHFLRRNFQIEKESAREIAIEMIDILTLTNSDLNQLDFLDSY